VAQALEISYLADHPEFIDALAPAIYEHWRHILTEETVEVRRTALMRHLNRDALPIAWVAHTESRVLGTAALRESDLPGREDLMPWLGGVFVLPEFRGRDIGKVLCVAVEKHASRLFNFKTLYLFTLDRQRWYEEMQWRMLEPCQWRGRSGDIMCKDLRAARQRFRADEER